MMMMEIEQAVFARKRWVPERMADYGFRHVGQDFILEKDFMDGDFRAVLTVTDQGAVSGQVIDTMTGAEYDQLRRREANGAYVNMVREAYRNLLLEIAGACSADVLFASDQANRLTDFIENKFHVSPDYPFSKTAHSRSYGTFRHEENRKWFALVMNVKRGVVDKSSSEDMVDIINLKIDPKECERLFQMPGIYPAYHMNHRTWISVVLDETVSDEKIMALIETSFALTE
jgi:predicted DNA-binding protein (MmcQ/YjbR family)